MEKVKQNIWISFFISLLFLWILGALLPKNPDKYLGERFWVLKAHKNIDCNFIILGDSRVYRGISPDEIESVLPEFEVFNFGFSNGGLNPSIFKAAEKRLSKDEEFRVVLLGVSAYSINPLSSLNRQYLHELKRPKEEVFERKYFGKYMNYLSPVTPEKMKDLINGIEPAVKYLNIYHDNGWVESEKNPADTMEAMPSYRNDFSKHTTSYELLEELCKQIIIWEAEDIKVFAFRPPAALPLRILEDSAGNYNESFIKREIQKAGGYWIDIDPTKYKTYDGSHLYREDARRISKRIAYEIKMILEI